MVWIPGGEFSMGAAESPDMNMVGMEATTDSRPIHRVYVDGFWMDTTEVTNEQFATFVEGHRIRDDRGAHAARRGFSRRPAGESGRRFDGVLAAGSCRGAERSSAVVVVREGANWRHPEGPASSLSGRDRYPVVHVAYDDAVAYANGRAGDCRPKRSGNSPLEAG